MVCGNFILPEPASYVFFYALFNLRNLLYIIYSMFKAEFVAGSSFSSLKELERTLNDYVLWYNNVRLHGSGLSVASCLPPITKSTCPINFGT